MLDGYAFNVEEADREMSASEVRQPTHLSLSIGPDGPTLGYSRDLGKSESPLDAFREINALLEKAREEMKTAPLKPILTAKSEPKKVSKCGSATFAGCGAEIYWENQKPYNPDGSPHRCKKP